MERAEGETKPIGSTSRRSPRRIGTGFIVARIGCLVRNAMCDAGSACGSSSCTSGAKRSFVARASAQRRGPGPDWGGRDVRRALYAVGGLGGAARGHGAAARVVD